MGPWLLSTLRGLGCIMLVVGVSASTQAQQASPTINAWRPQGDVIAVVDDQGAGQLINANTGLISVTWPASQGLTSVAWSPDGNFLAAGAFQAGDAEVRVWRTDDLGGQGAQQVATLGEVSQRVTMLTWSGDSQYLVVGQPGLGAEDGGRKDDNGMWIYDASNVFALVQSLQDGYKYDIAWSPNSNHMSISRPNWVDVVDMSELTLFENNLDLLSTYPQVLLVSLSTNGSQGVAQVLNVSWSPSGDTLALGDMLGGVYVFDVHNEFLVVVDQIGLGATFEDRVLSIDWSYNGAYIATSQNNGDVRVFDVRSRTLIYQSSGNGPTRVAFSPTDDRLTVGTTIVQPIPTPTPTPPPPPTFVLRQMFCNDTQGRHTWVVDNLTPAPTTFTWQVDASAQAGSGTVAGAIMDGSTLIPGQSQPFVTTRVTGAPNVVRVFVNGVLKAERAMTTCGKIGG